MVEVNKENERLLSHVRLQEVLSYDSETGIFTWKVQRGASAKKGWTAGTLRPSGYTQIKIDQIQYMAHRLAWLYVRGEWPEKTLDHENLNKSDNRICNLREATYVQNRANTPTNVDNRCGAKGVVWHTRDKRWQASIGINKKTVYLGYFTEKRAAKEAYRAAAQKQYGEFARFS